MLAFDYALAANRFNSLKRLIKTARCEGIMNSPGASGLNGAIVHKTFGRFVDYAGYYRGVKAVFPKDQEVVGHVTIPKNQALNLVRGCCDPIAIDSFLQVAGIHVNCLEDCKEDEIFVCTAIGELSFSEKFSQDETNERSWIVYSNFESTNKKSLVNDVLVLDSRSGELVLIIMGAQFLRLSSKSLEKGLSKLNSGSSDLETKTAQTRSMVHQDETIPQSHLSESQNTPNTDVATPISDESQGDQIYLLKRVQDMLSEVVEIPPLKHTSILSK